MLKYGVNDIRDFYRSNLDFLSQFKWKFHTTI
jgi:phenylalanyl-tRNA synthetase alpha subunit